MRERGLIAGDDAELDRLRGRATNAARQARFDDAGEASSAAKKRAEAIVVDAAFVKKKLLRFNKRFDDVTDAAMSKRLEKVSNDALDAIAAGKLVEANRALNTAFATLEGR